MPLSTGPRKRTAKPRPSSRFSIKAGYAAVTSSSAAALRCSMMSDRARSWASWSLSEAIRSFESLSSAWESFPETAAPSRMPTARAMNTAASETRW
jgi:hypothetical protein